MPRLSTAALVALLGTAATGAAPGSGVAAGEVLPAPARWADAAERLPPAGPADTIPPPDTVPPPPPDTIPPVPGDTIPPEPEAEEEDETVTPIDFPPYAGGPKAGRTGSIREWDREDLIAARGFTLVQLLEEVPGVLALRTGDHGHPAAATAFGLTAGRVRVFFDGFELAPLDGGIPDLSRISIGGLDRVRVERRPGELRIDLHGLRIEDAEPYSLIQAGTGDLSTNFFRGAFSHPDALGGNIVLSLDRLDTDGTDRRNPGALFGGHLRYSIHRGERGGVGFEVRRFSTRRPAQAFAPAELTRTDWLVRTRWRLGDAVVTEVLGGRSSLQLGGDLQIDTVPTEIRSTFDPGPRSQGGVRLRYEGDLLWAEADQRIQGGDGWPGTRTELRLGAATEWLGGADVAWEREGWRNGSGSTARARAWSRPLAGLSLFGEAETGRRGVPFVPAPPPPAEEEEEEGDAPGPAQQPAEDPPPALRFTDRDALRLGAEFRRGRLALSGAWIGLSSDAFPPFGLVMDRGAPAQPGVDMNAFEFSGNVPIPIVDGLALRGSVLRWTPETLPRYIPRTQWETRLAFHDRFFPTENLEVWADLGVRGRDRMFTAEPAAAPGEDPPGPAVVPFQPHWFFRLQIRVLTVRVFLDWDNLTNRTENRDFEDRPLPGMRALWGIRWTMWD